VRVGFLVGDLVRISGGSNVIIEHAFGLQKLGHEVVLVPADEWADQKAAWHPRLASLEVMPIHQARDRVYDVMFATWWRTVYELWKFESSIYGYFNQSYESRFHEERHYKLLNRCTYGLPLVFVTEATWIAEMIAMIQPAATVRLVPNGLGRDYFPCVEVPPSTNGPLRVLVEGPWGVPFKRVRETFELLGRVKPEVPLHVGWLTGRRDGQHPIVRGKPVEIHEQVPIDEVRTVLGRYDVMVKLSSVEGVFGPPLEMFSQGGTAITTTVSGSAEYLRHGHNALLVEPFCLDRVATYLELLHGDRHLLRSLRKGALETARKAPSWEESSSLLARQLEALLAGGPSHVNPRPALAALATLGGHWLEDLAHRNLAEEPGPWPHIGAGELLLLRRYRQLKRSPVVRSAMEWLSPVLRKRARSALERVLR
jgi:glycosyltransferase involved in cell wall biosynthesis